jgi:hypothetical protein
MTQREVIILVLQRISFVDFDLHCKFSQCMVNSLPRSKSPHCVEIHALQGINQVMLPCDSVLQLMLHMQRYTSDLRSETYRKSLTCEPFFLSASPRLVTSVK